MSESYTPPTPGPTTKDATATARIKKPRSVKASVPTLCKHLQRVEGVQTFAPLAQTFAKVGIYADQRMGELVAALPKATGNQYQQGASLPAGNKAKGEVLKDAGLTPKTASQLEQLAKNPEIVEAVIAKAEKDGRVVSRSQVLKAIKERDEARKVIGRSWGPIGDQKSKQARRLSV